MKNLVIRGALALSLASVWAVGCSESGKNRTEKEQQGTLHMNLETTSSSGKVYRLRQAVLPVQSLFTGQPAIVLESEDNPTRPTLEAFLAASSYLITLNDGWFIEQVNDLLGTATPIPATLLNGPTQFFDIQPDQETFVQFAFEVDGERVDFGQGRLIVGIEVIERNGEGGAPPGGLNPRRVLLETGQGVVSGFSLSGALAAAQQNSGLVPDPVGLYQQIIDSYASASQGQIPGSAHCGDETTNGAPTLNGYPISCDRIERLQFDNIDQWFPIAIANRVDLAPADGAHCGQQRIIFANNFPIGNGRMFAIFEAQIQNPNPACGIDACRPIAEFWASLNEENSMDVRRARLFDAFTIGAPELVAQGFGPFLTVENLSVGGGSIRTNNFNDAFWTLRQFKLLSDPLGQTRAIPFPVTDAPHGPLWNDTTEFPTGEQCRESFIRAIPGVLSDDPAEMAFVVDGECADAESPNDFFTEDYPFHLATGSGAFRSRLEEALSGTGLSPEDFANRARFAGSCMGCHQEANGAFLGNGAFAPFSNSFVHVDEFFSEDCGDGTSCFGASQALKDVFLPRRLRALSDLLGRPSACGGGDGGVSDGGVSDDGGTTTPPPSTDGGASGPLDAGPSLPTPIPAPPPGTVLTPDESVDDLVKEDEAARDDLSGETLGGQAAAVTH